ncbi:MAG: CotS family spore coat protein [Clostridiaceae bacterium]|nr:CotS family spore coat protein [Clostridiaceae bacterium]
MAYTANEPLDYVLSQYPFKVSDIRNESYKDKKGVWWIKTDKGMYILKKMSNSEEIIRFLLHAVNHLSSNGVSLPKTVKTSDGRDYVNVNGTCFVLLTALEGKNPSYSSPRELDSLMRELAKFHKASRGYSPPSDCKPKFHLGLWIEDYRRQIEEINEYYKAELAKKEHDAIGNTIMAEFPYFYERANAAIAGLDGQEYRVWSETALKSGSLCHQDFAAGNLLINPSGSVHVIDTDSITIDIPARDLRKILNKVMKKSGKWDTGLTAGMLRSYQSVNPLTRAQWNIVKLDLMFPHLFIGAVNKYIYKRDAEWNDDKYLKRIQEMARFEKTITNLLNEFDSIIPS